MICVRNGRRSGGGTTKGATRDTRGTKTRRPRPRPAAAAAVAVVLVLASGMAATQATRRRRNERRLVPRIRHVCIDADPAQVAEPRRPSYAQQRDGPVLASQSDDTDQRHLRGAMTPAPIISRLLFSRFLSFSFSFSFFSFLFSFSFFLPLSNTIAKGGGLTPYLPTYFPLRSNWKWLDRA